MSTLSLRKIKHDSSAVDNITLDSTGNIGVAASALSNSRIFLGGGNNQTALLFSNNSNGVVPPDVFGGAIDMNHSAGSCEVGFWNAYTANTLRSFAFYQRTGATTKNELMRIDTAGRITMPYQPAFIAVKNGNQTPNTTSATKITYELTELNTGGAYNTSTSRFTAPVAGNYLFVFMFNPYNITNAIYNLILYKNGSGIRNLERGIFNTDSDLSMSGSVVLNLNANDYIELYAQINDTSWGISGGGYWNCFSGYLIG